VGARQERERGTVDVGVEDADLGAAGEQGQGEVDRGRALADAALARGDGDDVAHAREARHLRARRLAAGGLARVRGHRDGDVVDAVEGQHPLAGRALELGLDRTGGRRQLDREGDARALDLQILDEPEVHDALLEVGVDDGAQGVEHLGGAHGLGHGLSFRRSPGDEDAIGPSRAAGD
jgi:hypothetical protein